MSVYMSSHSGRSGQASSSARATTPAVVLGGSSGGRGSSPRATVPAAQSAAEHASARACESGFCSLLHTIINLSPEGEPSGERFMIVWRRLQKPLSQALALACSAALWAAGTVARGDEPRPPEDPPRTTAGVVARALEEAWPDRPEWLDMYTDILQGSQLGPNDGWFRRAVAQTRFTWDAARARYDRDGDGKIL